MEHQSHLPPEQARFLLAKLEGLSGSQAEAVERFIDALSRGADEQEAARRHFAALASESFARTWDNPYDAAYDKL